MEKLQQKLGPGWISKGLRFGSSKEMLRLVGFVVVGALAGLAYNKFIGCRSGTCPITSNPYISTIYGAVMGFLVSGGFR